MIDRPITYHLSNGQRKELLVRGRELRIALPVPPHETPGELAWARMIRSVNPRALGDHLGQIVDDPHGIPCQCAEAIIVTLTPIGCRHHDDGLIQWPARVVFLGQEYPAP